MSLKFLDFDYSESVDGVGTLEAMATVDERHWPALQDEVQRVLHWCTQEFAGVRGPVDEDGDWDFDLHGSRERIAPLHLVFDAEGGQLEWTQGQGIQERFSVTLTLSGGPAFCQGLSERFGVGLT